MDDHRRKKKQPPYFTRRDGEIISIAGLWEEWKNPDTGQPLRSCTMIIGAANEFVSSYHDRMPIILKREQFGDWLGGKLGSHVLVPADSNVLQQHGVSMRVNSSRADENDVSLIAPL